MDAAARQEAESFDFPERQSRQARWSVHHAVKRGLDVFGSSTLLLVLAPVFLLIAVAVKARSRGPIFFGQPRVGQRMKSFTMLKLNDAPNSARRSITSTSPISSRQTPPLTMRASRFFKLTNDPRVTPIGHFLRKTSLDELPALERAARRHVAGRAATAARLRGRTVQPGTVAASSTPSPDHGTLAGDRTQPDDVRRMVRLDLRYAERSRWTDIKILLATPRAVIAGKVPADAAH
jgi:lipopolysaccharide/colanic/teichoic acid biosynthesis glycosyltransferase